MSDNANASASDNDSYNASYSASDTVNYLLVNRLEDCNNKRPALSQWEWEWEDDGPLEFNFAAAAAAAVAVAVFVLPDVLLEIGTDTGTS